MADADKLNIDSIIARLLEGKLKYNDFSIGIKIYTGSCQGPMSARLCFNVSETFIVIKYLVDSLLPTIFYYTFCKKGEIVVIKMQSGLYFDRN